MTLFHLICTLSYSVIKAHTVIVKDLIDYSSHSSSSSIGKVIGCFVVATGGGDGGGPAVDIKRRTTSLKVIFKNMSEVFKIYIHQTNLNSTEQGYDSRKRLKSLINRSACNFKKVMK